MASKSPPCTLPRPWVSGAGKQITDFFSVEIKDLERVLNVSPKEGLWHMCVFDSVEAESRAKRWFAGLPLTDNEIANEMGIPLADLSARGMDADGELTPFTTLHLCRNVWPLAFSWSSTVAQEGTLTMLVRAGVPEELFLFVRGGARARRESRDGAGPHGWCGNCSWGTNAALARADAINHAITPVGCTREVERMSRQQTRFVPLGAISQVFWPRQPMPTSSVVGVDGVTLLGGMRAPQKGLLAS